MKTLRLAVLPEKQTMPDDFWSDADIIDIYTRRQAIEDGVLVQLSGHGYQGDPWMPAMVAEAGFRYSRRMARPWEMSAWSDSLAFLAIRVTDLRYSLPPPSAGQQTDTSHKQQGESRRLGDTRDAEPEVGAP